MNQPASEPPRRRSPPREALVQRIRAFDPQLDVAAPRFRAAMLLLAATYVGQNVDRLARYTGYERSYVAKCARRLVDNGVWQAGCTVGDWVWDGTQHRAFWNDVGVAEGQLCRRAGAQGETEWAAAGVWSKHFEYVEPPTRSGLSVLYHDPAAPAPPVDLEQSETPTAIGVAAALRGEVSEATVASEATIESDRERRSVRRRRRALQGRNSPRRSAFATPRRPKLRPGRESEPRQAREALPAPFPELFPEATWLG